MEEIIDYHDIQYYDHLKKELTQPQMKKAIQFVKLGLIEYIGNNTFLCKKILGYNTRDYTLKRHPEFDWECNCQGWQSKKRKYDAEEAHIPTCSHISALYLYFKSKHSECWEQEAEQEMEQLKPRYMEAK